MIAGYLAGYDPGRDALFCHRRMKPGLLNPPWYNHENINESACNLYMIFVQIYMVLGIGKML